MQTNNRIAKQTDTTVIPFRPAFIPEGGFSEENPPDYSDGTNYVTPRWLYLQEMYQEQMKNGIKGDLYIAGYKLNDGGSTFAQTDIGYTHIGYCLGYVNTFIIRADGTLWSVGSNSDGQLGLGTDWVMEPYIYRQVGTDNDWKDVSIWESTTLGLKINGTLWGWGNNTVGQLGLGTTPNDHLVPVQIGTENNWKKICCGKWWSLAIKTDGTLWVTGSNSEGQIGLGDNSNRYYFTQVGTDTNWKDITSGEYFSFALKENGSLFMTGKFTSYQSIISTKNIFTKVFDNCKKISKGPNQYHAMLIDNDGLLFGMGNFGLAFGMGNTNSYNTFTQVGTDSDWVTVSCGNDYSYALKQNGTLWSTGANNYGQLGLGDGTQRTTFTQVGTDTDWKDVYCGQVHVIVLK